MLNKTAANDVALSPQVRKTGFWSLLTASIFGFRKRPRRVRAVMRRMRLNSLGSRLTIGCTIAAIVAGVATYEALTGRSELGHDPNRVTWLLDLDLIIVLSLAMLAARRVITIWARRRQGVAGSQLHARLLIIFGLLATAPAIIMTIFATFFLHFGVQSWFNDRVRTAITESQAVAEAYLHEHIQVIRADTMAMGNDLDHQASIFLSDPEAFRKIIQTQSMLRGLPEVAVFDTSGHILAHAGLSATLELTSIPADAMARADKGEVVVITKDHDDRVQALLRLQNFPNSYLFVGRTVDPTVLSHVTDTRMAVEQYERLEQQRAGLQVKITLIFIAVALLLLLAAIWLSLIFSRQLILPISALISAADKVRAGDLNARVPELERHDEFDVLARAFNRMTRQIQEQRDELVAANGQLDQRRRFTETVLAGVSSGIMGLDEDGVITLANFSAAALFHCAESELAGRNAADILPGLKALLAEAFLKPRKITQAELPFTGQRDEGRRTLLVRIAIELVDERERRAVVTFDDITELQSAQRKAAWSDVARRIAHEIKNPLTPIQLSAERLKRKYLRQISEDREIFSQCTDTIIDHVGDIERMVNEFSNFARMPEPVMKRDNLTRQLRDLLTLQQQAHPDIRFTMSEGKPVLTHFDVQQIRQAFTNIVQNAIDSIQTAGKPGIIDVLMTRRGPDGDIVIAVTDSGLGLPKNEDPARLTEPYVTHKEKGTGLGLAIVKKIMEDHKGRIVLGTPDWLKRLPGWQDRGGATVSLILPVEGVAGDEIQTIEQRRAIP